MIRILFICHGNICRSPMAQYILEDMAERAGVSDRFEIESAATSREEIGNGVYPPAREVLERHGILCGDHRARQITAMDCDYYDYIIAMEAYNNDRLLHMFPSGFREKFSLLMDYTEKPRDVSDPWYTRDFERAFQDISEGCEALFDRLLHTAKSIRS